MALPDYEGWACFVAVADSGNFTAAARSLGLSKASVSKAVSRLEASLGVTLLHRSSRVVAVSTAGGGLLGEARAMVAAATAATEAARGDRLDLADRKSTRLNSVTNAHLVCRLLLEKKKKTTYK